MVCRVLKKNQRPCLSHFRIMGWAVSKDTSCACSYLSPKFHYRFSSTYMFSFWQRSEVAECVFDQERCCQNRYIAFYSTHFFAKTSFWLKSLRGPCYSENNFITTCIPIVLSFITLSLFWMTQWSKWTHSWGVWEQGQCTAQYCNCGLEKKRGRSSSEVSWMLIARTTRVLEGVQCSFSKLQDGLIDPFVEQCSAQWHCHGFIPVLGATA